MIIDADLIRSVIPLLRETESAPIEINEILDKAAFDRAVEILSEETQETLIDFATRLEDEAQTYFKQAFYYDNDRQSAKLNFAIACYLHRAIIYIYQDWAKAQSIN